MSKKRNYYRCKKYFKRAQYYKNLFDKETGFMRPKQNGDLFRRLRRMKLRLILPKAIVGFIRFSCRTMFRV